MPDDPTGKPATPPDATGSDEWKTLRIIQWPDPRLTKKSEPVTTFDNRLRSLAIRMLELMRGSDGVGLAAPQVGLNIRMFVMNASGKPEDDRVYVNPKLSDAEGGEEAEEGCLSLPDIHVNVTRPTVKLRMQAQDVNGDPIDEVATGFPTRVWQHETDHLNGILLLDRMGPVTRLQYRKRLKELEEEYAELQAPKKRKLKLPF